MRALRLLLPLAITCAVSTIGNAAEPRTREDVRRLLQSSYTTINGKDVPDLVPYRIRMQFFFDRYKASGTGGFQAQIKPLISQADEAILSAYADRHVKELKEDEVKYRQAWMNIASGARDLDAKSLANAIKAATIESERAAEARYRSVLRELSNEGQRVVSDFAFEKVRPVCAVEDPAVVAAAAPEFYKAQIIGTYEMLRSGKEPPPPDPALVGPNRSDAPITTQSTDVGQLNSTPNQ